MQILVLQRSEEYASRLQGRLSYDVADAVRVQGASSLKAGLEELSKGNTDLVLLELSLPDSNGLDTFEKVQAQAPHVPVVILTGLEEELLALKALRQGAQDYLLKSEFDGKLLSRILRNAIERQRLKTQLLQLSFNDDLTGLYNRRGYYCLTGQQIKLSERSGKGLAVILADMDNLKKINDVYGHPEGDQAILRAAAVLRQTFRKSDILARLGGDEFAITAIEAQAGTEKLMLDRLAANLKQQNISQKNSYELSMSFGFAFYDPAHPQPVEELIEKADQALYHSKKSRKAALS